MLTQPLRLPLTLVFVFCFGSAYFLMIAALIPNFFHWDGNTTMGLMLLPFICKVDNKKQSLRYLVPAVLSLALATMIKVQTLYFIALIFSILFLIESWYGTFSESTFFLIFVISPVFTYMVHTVDFSIRLWLTEKVVLTLNFMGSKAVALGNVIAMNDSSFSVDPACAGLNMLVISLIITLFLVTNAQKQTGRHLDFIITATLFLFTIGLNILSNFFRILLLVMYRIMPGSVYHDLIGIATLLIYVILPLVIVIGPVVMRFGKKLENASCKATSSQFQNRYLILHGTFVITLLFIATHIVKADQFVTGKSLIQLPGYNRERLQNGIFKFTNNNTLVYVKPTSFYIPGHDPKICWTGSGYRFTSIRKERFDKVDVYTALLQKGKEKIYGSWWYDNGRQKTVDQVEWRWASLIGAAPFYLINVNAAHRSDLELQIKYLLKNSSYLGTVSNPGLTKTYAHGN